MIALALSSAYPVIGNEAAASSTLTGSMEIGSAYALQVCLLQIPAMVAFSAFYDPGKMGELVDTFT